VWCSRLTRILSLSEFDYVYTQFDSVALLLHTLQEGGGRQDVWMDNDVIYKSCTHPVSLTMPSERVVISKCQCVCVCAELLEGHNVSASVLL